MMDTQPWDYRRVTRQARQGTHRRDRCGTRTRNGQEPGSPRRHSPLHPHSRGLRPAGARAGGRRQVGGADPGGRTYRPHAEPHLYRCRPLLSMRSTPTRPRVQSMKTILRPSPHGSLSAGLLSSQCMSCLPPRSWQGIRKQLWRRQPSCEASFRQRPPWRCPWCSRIWRRHTGPDAMFGQPDAVLALPVPENAPTYVKAMRHYARGVALVEQGRFADVPGEIAALQSLSGAEDLVKLRRRAFPVPEDVDDRAGSAGRPNGHGQRRSGGRDPVFERAAQMQEALAYMEPPYWYYPVRQSLGAALCWPGDPMKPGRLSSSAEAFAKQRLGAVRIEGGREGSRRQGRRGGRGGQARQSLDGRSQRPRSQAPLRRPSDLRDRHGGEELPWRRDALQP